VRSPLGDNGDLHIVGKSHHLLNEVSTEQRERGTLARPPQEDLGDSSGTTKCEI